MLQGNQPRIDCAENEVKMNFWALSQLAFLCQEALWESGMEIRQETDFRKVAPLVEAMGKEYLTPILSPKYNDFTESNCFWLVAEKDGEPHIIGGARKDDLRKANPSIFLQTCMDRAYGAGEVSNISPSVDAALAGRAVYFGDIYSKQKSAIGRKARFNLRLFTTIAHVLSEQMFAPDVVYSFMRDDHVMRGAADLYGFTQRIQKPLSWATEPYPRENSEWLVYRRKEAFGDFFSRSAEFATTI